MATPKGSTFHNDVDIYQGGDTSTGNGDLTLHETTSTFTANGLSNLFQTNIDTSPGSLNIFGTSSVLIKPTGSSGIVQILGGNTSYFQTTSGDLQLISQTGILTETGTIVNITSTTGAISLYGQTNITNTALAAYSITAGTNCSIESTGYTYIDSGATSHFIVDGGGDLQLHSVGGKIDIEAGSSATNAIDITTTNAAGGIRLDCGTNGLIATATNGQINLVAQSASSGFSLATNADSQNLSFALTGTTNSSLIISSTGTGSSAVNITTSAINSGINMSSGTGGITETTTGGISLNAQNTSNMTVTGTSNLTLNSTLGQVIVSSGKTNSATAVNITATNISGGITMTSGTTGITETTTGGVSLNSNTTSNFTLTGTDDLTIKDTGGRLILESDKAANDAIRILAGDAAGGIDIDSGTGGINMTSLNTISLNASDASSNFTLATSSNSQNLSISLTGATNSSLILSSTGTSNTNAIQMSASAGGININSVGTIAINTTDTINGVYIATSTNTVPVHIGTSNSVTTIAGDLVIQGLTTSVQSTTVTVDDNVLELNAGNSTLGIDSGMIIRRYQTPNDIADGDVITDTPKETGTFQTGSATPGTLVLSSSASSTNNIYNGWWILITSGSGINQVRRIKTYVGSTKTATIYVTADNTTAGVNSAFTDGLNLTTAPASGDTYSLFNLDYAASYYKASNKYWTLAYSALLPNPISTPGASNISVQKYMSLYSGSIYISDDTGIGNSLLNVNYINETTLDQGVTIEGVLIKDGLINGNTPDTTEIVVLQDNSTTPVNIVNTATAGAYFIVVENVQGATGTNALTRVNSGAKATFTCASRGSGGDNNRLVSIKGTANQQLDIVWTLGNKAQLKHSPAFSGGTGVNVYYRVKIVNSLL